MENLEGKLKAVITLVAKYMKKQNCNEGVIDFDYESMMNTWGAYSSSNDGNAFGCKDSGKTYSFPFDVRSILEDFVSKEVNNYADGFIGSEMLILVDENVVKIYENYEEYVEYARNTVDLEATNSSELAEVCEDYVDKNIREVSWDISGGGDSGYIEDYPYNIEYVDNDDPNKPTSVDRSTTLDDLCYMLLNRNFGGWENNEGGQGTCRFYAAEGKLEIELGVNEVETKSEVVGIYKF